MADDLGLKMKNNKTKELWWIRRIEGQIKHLNNFLTERGKLKKKHQDKLHPRQKINQKTFYGCERINQTKKTKFKAVNIRT